MNMKIWNFVQTCSGIENMVLWVENYVADEGDNTLSIELNAENIDDETIDASVKLYAKNDAELEKQYNEIIKEYFSGIDVNINY